MNITTVITVGKTVVKFAQEGVKYLKEDYSHWTGLEEPVTIEVYSKGIGRFNFANDTLSITSPNSDCVILHSERFSADSRYWNLASIVKDAHEKGGCDDGRDEGSLFHDLIDTFNSDIAKANQTTGQVISDWSDKILAIVWRSYGKKKGKDGWRLNVKTKLALNACGSFLRKYWSKIAGLFVISFSLFFVTGCDEVPDGHSTTPDIHYTTVTNVVEGVR